MPMPLHHLALRTTDVAALAAFYREVFGFALVREVAPRSLWLGLGGGAVLMIEAREAGETAAAPGSMELIAFRVDRETRASIGRKAREFGCYDGETAFTVYLRDPDGRRLGASTYDFASASD